MITTYRCAKCGMAYLWLTLARMCEVTAHQDKAHRYRSWLWAEVAQGGEEWTP